VTIANTIERAATPVRAGAPAFETLLACPADGSALTRTADGFSCASGRNYKVVDDIPLLFQPNEKDAIEGDVTDIVKAFYEETPFPNYDDLDSRDSLAHKANRGIFARLLNEQIPAGGTMLEAGCGTGQLSNFLGMSWNRTVVGADLCLNSLRLATGFRKRFSVRNAHFLQMNLFKPPFRDNCFDIVMCSGVLHHTADPHGGFISLLRTAKPGGHVIIGLYNQTGRLTTDWRRMAIRMFGDPMAKLDSKLRGQNLNEGRWQAWFRDQYKHPHESKHTYGEVLRWFDDAGVDYVSSIPAIDGTPLMAGDDLFRPQPRGNVIDRGWIQLEMLLEGGVDGGLFIMIGRKRA
jgi:ubiquinone/menaquinone biosynthesis C-methylase UbiE